MYDILLIFQYQVSTTVMDLFVFMLVLLCFCVATEFSVNKDLYINGGMKDRGKIRQPVIKRHGGRNHDATLRADELTSMQLFKIFIA